MNESNHHNLDFHVELCQLFSSCFNEAELRRFVALLPGAAGLASRLPGPAASLEDLAFEVVLLLERERLLPIAFDQLNFQRPRHTETIEALRRCLADDSGGTSPLAPRRDPPFYPRSPGQYAPHEMISGAAGPPRWFSLRLRIGCLTIVAALSMLTAIWTAAALVEHSAIVATRGGPAEVPDAIEFSGQDPFDLDDSEPDLDIFPSPSVRPDEPPRMDAPTVPEPHPSSPVDAYPHPSARPLEDPARIVRSLITRNTPQIARACRNFLDVFDHSRMIRVDVQISGDGRVRIEVVGPDEGTHLGRCIEHELAKLRFPVRATSREFRGQVRIVIRS